MANQHVNKVAVNGQTVLDLSGDTVYPGMLAKGITAHDKSGAQIIGTLEVPATEERMVELSMPSGNQVILPTSGKVMRKVTVQKPDTLLPENIKKDVVIGGVTGSLEAGDTSETWIIKSSATGGFTTTQIAFTSNGRKFTSIGANDSSGIAMVLYYDNYEAAGYDIAGGVYEFENEAYRTITFDTHPTGALLSWLQSNATKQASGVSVQPSKSVSITQNGTTTVTPDTGYDALGKVEVSVDVASSMPDTNVLTFEYTPTTKTLDISHDVLVGAGIDTEDKFFKIIGISIFPKNGDVDWFYLNYGGALDKASFMQHLQYIHCMPKSGDLAFYNLSGTLPYTIALQTAGADDTNAVNKTFIVTLLLSE
jgi:hypothetical protein